MPINISRIDMRTPSGANALAALRAQLAADGDIVSEAGRRKTLEVFGERLSPREVVERICRDVQKMGVKAVLGYTAKLDGAMLTSSTLRVSPDELTEAHDGVDAEFLVAIRRIRENILRFQSAILHVDMCVDLPDGAGWLRQRYTPLARVGCCVPGGAAAYPSTVLMTAVPAQAAGVQDIVVVAPPTQFGGYNRELLATCHELGLTEVYRVGGAQGVAAMAYGAGIPRVDKIVGPGNLFVALAKRRVFGEVGIDSIAGPSEVVVIADSTSDADWVAADLIAQAEHSPGASVLLSWEASYLDAVAVAMEAQLMSLTRGELASVALEEFGALVQVSDHNEAARLANEIAPEHLHIECDGAEELAEQIHNAGATFVGPFSPVAIGDYAAGPSHVLPTSGSARFASGLSSNDFLRAGSVIHITESGLTRIANDAIHLARIEGLTGHAASISQRIKD